jgi:hypothetical protein
MIAVREIGNFNEIRYRCEIISLNKAGTIPGKLSPGER